MTHGMRGAEQSASRTVAGSPVDGLPGVDRRNAWAQGGEANLEEMVDQGAFMGPHDIAAALNGLAMGEGSRPVGHVFRDGLRGEWNRAFAPA